MRLDWTWDRKTAERLVEAAVRERRLVPWHVEVLLRSYHLLPLLGKCDRVGARQGKFARQVRRRARPLWCYMGAA